MGQGRNSALAPESGAVEWVRAIRDVMAEELAGKSDAEILAHFRRAGEAARADAHRRTENHGIRARGT